MKKLLLLIVTVVFSTGVFAQTTPATKMDSKSASTATTDKTMKTHCYAMKDGAMMHCMGSKAEPMAKDATLKNGTMVSTAGVVTTKDGKKTTLSNGQCIDVNGKIGDFDKMHAKMNDKKNTNKM